MIEFLMANWYSIIMVLIIIVSAIYLAAKGQTNALESILFALVTQAEKECGSGTGALKLSKVIDWSYEKIPSWARPFITVEKLTDMINDAVEAAKKVWDKNDAIKTWVNTK